MAAGKWPYYTTEYNYVVILYNYAVFKPIIYVKLNEESDMIIGIHVRYRHIDVVQDGRQQTGF